MMKEKHLATQQVLTILFFVLNMVGKLSDKLEWMKKSIVIYTVSSKRNCGRNG